MTNTLLLGLAFAGPGGVLLLLQPATTYAQGTLRSFRLLSFASCVGRTFI
jgi:hypothetical protein